MTLAAGIVIGVRNDGQNAVALQIRGENETSFRGGAQVTAHGKLEADELALPIDEAFRAGLRREVREELGDVIAEMIEAAEDNLVLLHEQITAKKTIRTFGLDLGIEFADFEAKVKPCDEVAGFVVVTSPKEMRPYRDGEKEFGVPSGELAMFPDEITAVTIAFETLFPEKI